MWREGVYVQRLPSAGKAAVERSGFPCVWPMHYRQCGRSTVHSQLAAMRWAGCKWQQNAHQRGQRTSTMGGKGGGSGCVGGGDINPEGDGKSGPGERHRPLD